MAVAIGLLEVEFLIPGASSLKDKRRVVRSLKDRMRHRLNVSVAEVDHQDLHGRCHLAVVTISPSRERATEVLSTAEGILNSNLDIQVIDRQLQWL